MVTQAVPTYENPQNINIDNFFKRHPPYNSQVRFEIEREMNPLDAMKTSFQENDQLESAYPVVEQNNLPTKVEPLIHDQLEFKVPIARKKTTTEIEKDT